MKIYKVKSSKLSGSNFSEVHKKARKFYESIIANSRRKPYIRCAYFKKEKIFLDLFWSHIYQKNRSDQVRRMKLLPCAIELLLKSKVDPISKQNTTKESEILHRFIGITSLKETFYVQVKELRKSGKKWLISIFPNEK